MNTLEQQKAADRIVRLHPEVHELDASFFVELISDTTSNQSPETQSNVYFWSIWSESVFTLTPNFLNI